MKLSYRGINYDRTPSTVETIESSVVGKYRGKTLRLHHARQTPAAKKIQGRVYRGVAY